MGQRMSRGGEVVSDDHERAAALRLQVLRDGGEPLGVDAAWQIGWRGAGDFELASQGAEELLRLRGTQRQAVIGRAAGGGVGALEHVETVRFDVGILLLALGAATRHEVVRVAHRGPAAREEVGVDRDDDVGIREIVDRRQVGAEGELSPLAGVVAADRFVLMPASLRQRLQQGLALAGERRRRDRRAEDSQPRTVAADRQCAAGGADEFAPGGDDADVLDRLRTVGIVHRQDRGLGEGVGSAEARRMELVTFKLRRPAHVAGGDQADGAVAGGHRRGEVIRQARRDPLGLPDVRHDLFGRSLAAPLRAGERDGGGHQLQEAATIGGRLLPDRGKARELAHQSFFERRIAG